MDIERYERNARSRIEAGAMQGRCQKERGEDVEAVHNHQRNAIPRLVKEYNNTKHCPMKMSPVEASKKKNEKAVYENLYGDLMPVGTNPKFAVGGRVVLMGLSCRRASKIFSVLTKW